MLLASGQTIVFAGDSITDAGRRSHAVPFGEGYVNSVRAILAAGYPQLMLKLINAGVNGDTARNLSVRWKRDVIAEQPHWISIFVGINDVWRAFEAREQEAVLLPEYETLLRRMLDTARAANETTRFILMAPYLIEANQQDPMLQRMREYGALLHTLADEYGALFVDVQAAFDAVLAHTTQSNWSDDRIHPDFAGHTVIALAWLRAVGFSL